MVCIRFANSCDCDRSASDNVVVERNSPASRVISLRDVLLQVEALTGFLGKFQHQGHPQKPTRPDTRLLLAALIGYGENIGIRKMAAAADRPDFAQHFGSGTGNGGHAVFLAGDDPGGQ